MPNGDHSEQLIDGTAVPAGDVETAEMWLRARVAELESRLDGIRRRRAQALDGEHATVEGDGESLFRHVLSRLPTPLLVLADDDTVLFANSAAVQFFGTSFGTPAGRALGDCIDPVRAGRLAALRPDGDEDRTHLDAPDGSGPVLCHAFLACVEGYTARCLQIEWHPPSLLGHAP